MLERLLRGEQLIQEELDRLGQMVGLNRADDLRQREWMARRMAQALRFREVQEALQAASGAAGPDGDEQAAARSDARNSCRPTSRRCMEQLRQHAGQQIAENMAEQRPDESIDELLNRPFNALSDRDMDRLRKEVQRLAALLRSRVALRQKRAKTGQLDAKATIRANLKHGSVPIEIKHRDRRLKPKLVVICDISTSMRPCSELMLSLIYAMQDQISKTHAFAFIDRLEYISPDFEGQRGQVRGRRSIACACRRATTTPISVTAWRTSLRTIMDTVDCRTTFIVVGDGRNNYNDPRLDLFIPSRVAATGRSG